MGNAHRVSAGSVHADDGAAHRERQGDHRRSGGDKPTRGQFVAVDAQTGQLLWRFYTVPGDPSKPYESEALRRAAKTWGGDFWKNGGGGAVWDGFAYDPEANLVYVGTGNAEPWVQKFRGAQGLDNLYTCSILAVDLNTGLLKWHYQAVPNDNWDYDNVQQLMLLDLNINGRMRKVITQAAKNGFFYVLDRVTGEFISAEPFVKVSWALSMGKDGRPVVNPAAYYDQDPISIYPTWRRCTQLVAHVVQPEHRAGLYSVVLLKLPLSGSRQRSGPDPRVTFVHRDRRRPLNPRWDPSHRRTRAVACKRGIR